MTTAPHQVGALEARAQRTADALLAHTGDRATLCELPDASFVIVGAEFIAGGDTWEDALLDLWGQLRAAERRKLLRLTLARIRLGPGTKPPVPFADRFRAGEGQASLRSGPSLFQLGPLGPWSYNER